MNTKAMVNYHVSSDQPQAFHIDAGGEKGKLLSPTLAPTEVEVLDIRDHHSHHCQPRFWQDSLSFVKHTSSIQNFTEFEDWQASYNQELTQLLSHELKAQEVIIFDHTVRIDNPEAERQPARNVHSDYSTCGAHERLKDVVGETKAQQWQHGHFGFVNIWRPVQTVITRAPLGFVLPHSVKDDDWISLDLIYPDRIGQIMGLLANPNHQWVYHSKMTPDDIALFNIYDNQGLASIGHSALDIIDHTNTATRKSIESRTLIRY